MASGVATPGAIPANAQSATGAAIQAGDRWQEIARWLTWGGFSLILVVAALAPITRTGDAHQYYAMAMAMADQRPPALTPDEVDRYKAWLEAQPGESGFAGSVRAVDQPPLIVDGRQEFSHFWLYPLLAAPVVALLERVELHPGYAFLAVNAMLLAAALWAVQRALSPVVSLLLLATPVIWFVNKAQVEVFTFALLSIAMAQAARGRFLWAALAAAIASTQNVPILGAVACFWGAGILRQIVAGKRGPVTVSGVLIVLATIAVGAMHPLYYQWRLGVLTPQHLNGGIELHVPALEKYLAVLADPNIGLLPWLPLYGLVAALGLVLIWLPMQGEAAGAAGSSNDAVNLRLAALCGLVIGAWFLAVFAQTTNVNSGGTVHMSRYALWLVPLGLPLLAATARQLHAYVPAALPVAATLAVVGYGLYFQPARAEVYTTPSPQATAIVAWLPELYRTVPEIFYERLQQVDGGARGSAASDNCRIILLHAEAPEVSCLLTPEERAAADRLLGQEWLAVWIVRPGPLALGEGSVTGAVPVP